MTRYARSRLHDEVAAYLAFWAIAGRSELEPWGSSAWSLAGPREPEPTADDPWAYLRRCIAVLNGDDEE